MRRHLDGRDAEGHVRRERVVGVLYDVAVGGQSVAAIRTILETVAQMELDERVARLEARLNAIDGGPRPETEEGGAA